ncbi:hypothetical protein F5B17DRAFT_303878 [Nemania serpens]|nr:hypothetical protein F5B17DRAFT_303878 [Nemania serpens]
MGVCSVSLLFLYSSIQLWKPSPAWAELAQVLQQRPEAVLPCLPSDSQGMAFYGAGVLPEQAECIHDRYLDLLGTSGSALKLGAYQPSPAQPSLLLCFWPT